METNITQRITRLKPIPQKKLLRSFVSDETKKRIDVVYYFEKASGRILAKVVFGEEAQGPPGYAHGGAIAAVLDESMGAASWLNGFMVMTAKLELNYLKAVPLHEKVFIEAWITEADEKKIHLHSRLIDKTGKPYSTGKGLFIKLSKERLKSLGPIPEGLLQQVQNGMSGV